MTTSRTTLRQLMRRRSTVAFLMTLPLIVLILVLVAYPAGFAIYISMLDRTMTKFVWFRNFEYLLGRERFWLILFNTTLFALVGVVVKSLIGFAAAHLINNIPARRQRKWRGMLLLPWVIPPAMGTLGWRLLFDPSFSPWNWLLEHVGIGPIGWVVEPWWARFSVIWVSVWFSAPFFMVMYLAALKSVPEELYEAASIDGASWWQRTRYVTLPLTRNMIAITVLFNLIGSFAGFTLVAVLTNGGPLGTTEVLGTLAFKAGIAIANLPMGSAVALFMVPILAVCATVILRRMVRRGGDA
jgi:multiple sugar transport system permease protein